MHIVVLYDHLLLPCLKNVRATRPPKTYIRQTVGMLLLLLSLLRLVVDSFSGLLGLACRLVVLTSYMLVHWMLLGLQHLFIILYWVSIEFWD